MLTWGGYVDGVSYLLVLLAFLWMPTSIPLALLVVALATLNHYLGTIAILVTAAAFFIDRGERRYQVSRGFYARRHASTRCKRPAGDSSDRCGTHESARGYRPRPRGGLSGALRAG